MARRLFVPVLSTIRDLTIAVVQWQIQGTAKLQNPTSTDRYVYIYIYIYVYNYNIYVYIESKGIRKCSGVVWVEGPTR